MHKKYLFFLLFGLPLIANDNSEKEKRVQHLMQKGKISEAELRGAIRRGDYSPECEDIAKFPDYYDALVDAAIENCLTKASPLYYLACSCSPNDHVITKGCGDRWYEERDNKSVPAAKILLQKGVSITKTSSGRYPSDCIPKNCNGDCEELRIFLMREELKLNSNS